MYIYCISSTMSTYMQEGLGRSEVDLLTAVSAYTYFMVYFSFTVCFSEEKIKVRMQRKREE